MTCRRLTGVFLKGWQTSSSPEHTLAGGAGQQWGPGAVDVL